MEKWEWTKSSDPQSKGGMENENESHTKDIHKPDETPIKLTDYLVDGDVFQNSRMT